MRFVVSMTANKAGKWWPWTDLFGPIEQYTGRCRRMWVNFWWEVGWMDLLQSTACRVLMGVGDDW